MMMILKSKFSNTLKKMQSSKNKTIQRSKMSKLNKPSPKIIRTKILMIFMMELEKQAIYKNH